MSDDVDVMLPVIGGGIVVLLFALIARSLSRAGK